LQGRALTQMVAELLQEGCDLDLHVSPAAEYLWQMQMTSQQQLLLLCQPSSSCNFSTAAEATSSTAAVIKHPTDGSSAAAISAHYSEQCRPHK